MPQDTSPPDWQNRQLRLAIEAAGVALWVWDVDTDRLAMDAHGFALWNMPVDAGVTFAALSEHIHPADRDRVRAAFAATRAVVGTYEIDFRTLIGDEIR